MLDPQFRPVYEIWAVKGAVPFYAGIESFSYWLGIFALVFVLGVIAWRLPPGRSDWKYTPYIGGAVGFAVALFFSGVGYLFMKSHLDDLMVGLLPWTLPASVVGWALVAGFTSAGLIRKGGRFFVFALVIGAVAAMSWAHAYWFVNRVIHPSLKFGPVEVEAPEWLHEWSDVEILGNGLWKVELQSVREMDDRWQLMVEGRLAAFGYRQIHDVWKAERTSSPHFPIEAGQRVELYERVKSGPQGGGSFFQFFKRGSKSRVETTDRRLAVEIGEASLRDGVWIHPLTVTLTAGEESETSEYVVTAKDGESLVELDDVFVPLLSRDEEADPLYTENVTCDLSAIGLDSCRCSGVLGGPLGNTWGPLSCLISTDRSTGRTLGRLAMGVATLGIVDVGHPYTERTWIRDSASRDGMAVDEAFLKELGDFRDLSFDSDKVRKLETWPTEKTLTSAQFQYYLEAFTFDSGRLEGMELMLPHLQGEVDERITRLFTFKDGKEGAKALLEESF